MKFVAGDWGNESDENVIESVTLTYDLFELIRQPVTCRYEPVMATILLVLMHVGKSKTGVARVRRSCCRRTTERGTCH